MNYERFSLIIALLLCLCLNLSYAEENKINYEITRYDINVRIPNSYDKLQIDVLLDIRKLVPSASNQLEVMLCKHFKNAESTNIKVMDGGKMPLPFKRDGDILTIKLPGESQKKETEKLLISYDLRKKEARGDRHGKFAFEISENQCHINSAITRTDNWYPKIKGTLIRRLPEFKLSIDVPSRFQVMASGKLKQVIRRDGRLIYKWENYKGLTDRSLFFFAAKKRKIVKKYPGDFRVIMYVPEDSPEENVDYIADVIYRSYKLFESLFGKVPGNEYKIFAFAQGYSGLFNSQCAPISLFTKKIHNNEICFPTRTIIHEVSHTWWGNMVSAEADKDYWLFEGFAKFSEIIGIKEAVGIDIEKKSFFRLKLCTIPYLGYEPAIVDSAKTKVRTLEVTSAYYKGAMFLNLLEFTMGRESFYEGMKDYVRSCRGKCVATDDFIRIMQKHTVVDLGVFAKDYLEKPGFAEYTIKKVGVLEENGHYIHTFEIENVGDKIIYTNLKVESPLENYTKKLVIKKKGRFIIKVKSLDKLADDIVIKVDPDNIFPIWKSGMRGCGGIVYVTPGKEIVFYGVIDDAPLARAGIKNGMKLLKIDGEELAGKDLEELNLILLKPAGTHLKLLVKSGKKEPGEVIVVYR